MGRKILIVDDSLTVRSDLEEAFEEAGMAALACANAAEARAALDAGQVGVMVLDVQLPDADGVAFLREIRADRRHAALPVLMLSSEADVRDRIRGLMTGSNDYVGKPYDRDYVILRAQELMRERDECDERDEQGRSGDGAARASVLVIDDSRTFRERLGELLREQRFAVRFAETGEEGLKSAALHRPAAVVVDGELPGIDGATVIRKLRLDAVLRDTTCILLTGSEDRGAELRALDAGADAFVTKGEDIGIVLARVTAALRNASRSAHGETASLHAPKRILAADDSITYLQSLNDILSGEGYDVILARSGEEALDMLAVQSVDCILLDRLMPGMGGTEACRLLKASPATRDIPLIMLTAMEDREAMIEGLSTGADDYVLKSSELDVLKARVRAQLRRKQFEDESRRVRTETMNKELDAAEARAARELAESRAELLAILEQKNGDLEEANAQLTDRQAEIAEKNLQLEEASRMKSEFLSNMSHELRTPLNAIIGFSEVLKDGMFGELTPRQKEYVTEVFNSGQHLLSLINDILDLSKVEAGMMTLELSVIALNDFFDNTLGIVRERAIKSRVQLEFSPCPDPPEGGRLHADARKLKQIVYNMLSNAVKFSNEGGLVRLELHAVPRHAVCLVPSPGMACRMLAAPTADTPLYLRIDVTDEGIGIAEDDLPRLFQAFRQLGRSLARQHEGTGLGLALVMRLAELHGGTVGVESAPGKGTRFTVWIPWRTGAAPAKDNGN